MRMIAVAAAVWTVFAWTAQAGSLTPPGAPAATMKTLDALEARTPIWSLPCTITAPGSYYLGKSLSLATQDTHGITIEAGNVTLDLNGYALIGPGKTVGSSGDAVYVVNPHKHNITVCNGAITGWRGVGVDANYTLNAQLTGLKVSNNGGAGIDAGYGAVITDNASILNGGDGIWAGPGSVVRSNVCRSNGQNGISASNDSAIADNACANNSQAGIDAYDHCTLRGNNCANNTTAGINAHNGCLIEANNASNNGDDGIRVGSYNRVIGNNAVFNVKSGGSAAGVEVAGNGNTVQENTVASNDVGVDCPYQPNNYFASNCANGNTTNYNIAAGNTQGSGDLANVNY